MRLVIVEQGVQNPFLWKNFTPILPGLNIDRYYYSFDQKDF